MTIGNKTLDYLKTNAVFVDLFADRYDNSHYGFIRKFNDDYLLLEHYNNEGAYDGILVFKRSNVSRIKWDSNDINNTQKLIDKPKASQKVLDIKINAVKIESMVSILKTVQKQYNYVSIQVQDLDNNMMIIGQVQEIDEDTVVIKEYGTRSSMDRGITMLAIDDITRVDADAIYENGIVKMHQGRTLKKIR